MKRFDAPPVRWVDDPSSLVAPGETRAAALLGVVARSPVTGWGASSAARVRARLVAAARRRDGRRAWDPPSWRTIAMGSTLVGVLSWFLGGAVLAAGLGALWRFVHPSPEIVPLPASSPLPARRSVRRGQLPLESPPPVPPPSSAVIAPPDPQPATEALPRAAVKAQRRGANASSGATTPSAVTMTSPVMPSPLSARAPVAVSPAATSELGRETALLDAAVTALRHERDAAGALRVLDQFALRFPHGLLAGEAQRARVDALLLLGRRDEALAALTGMELLPVGRGLELVLIRAELQAQRECLPALADFSLVLSREAPPAFRERALWGRAACRERLGRPDEAREDARAYLTHFPRGRFQERARRLLDAP